MSNPAPEHADLDRKKRGPEGLRAVDRATSILFALAGHPSGLSLPALSRETGITLTTVHRMVGTLRASRLTRETASGLQALGPGALILARGFLGGLDFRVEALPVLAELRDATDETCHLGTLANPHVVYVDKLDSGHSVGIVSRIGATAPAITSALGKAILAHSPEATISAVIQSSQSQLGRTVDEEELRGQLQAVRDRGYSTDIGENEKWVCAIGAPVFDDVGDVIAAISVALPTERFQPAATDQLGSLVRNSADRISAALGHDSHFHLAPEEFN